MRVVFQGAVVRLESSGYSRAQSALGRAFFNYNLMRYAAADDARRAPAVNLLYNAMLWDAFRWGEVYVPAGGFAAAAWLPPPYAYPTFLRQVRSGMIKLPLRFGLGGFTKLLAYDGIAHKLHHRHAPMPHWYLLAIGVEPEHQGQGVAGAIMRPILERADDQHVPCYLETHEEKNVRIYQRHGFEIAERAEVPGHPIPVWAMLRAAR